MSAHLTDQDCINALATLWYEYHKQPRSESPQNALERAFLIANEEVSTKTDYFENQNELRYRAIRLIEAQQPVYKGLASCKVIFDILFNENIRSLQAIVILTRSYNHKKEFGLITIISKSHQLLLNGLMIEIPEVY